MPETCAICGGQIPESARRLSLGDRRKGVPGSWQVVECEKCSVLSVMPLPTDEQLSAYYADYSKDERVDLSQSAGSRHPGIRKMFHRLSGDVDPRDFVKIPAGARVLDYGCGRAGYLRDFQNRGVAISGAEIAGYVVKLCRKSGYDVRKVDDLSHIPFGDGEFDVVYLMQVFEHLRDPHAFMKELGRILKTGGQLYLAVPNAASIWRKIFNVHWVSGWFAPFHLFHYTREALERVARQHGLTMVESWSRTPVGWFALNLKAAVYPKENQLDWFDSWLTSGLVRNVLMLFLRIVELPFRERDCLVMVFEKRE